MNLEQGKKLVELARDSISKQLKGDDDEADKSLQKEFSEKQGVFVTLTIDGQLRGCIGFPEPIMELWKGVVEGAKSAAFSDPRFQPMDENEWKNVCVEISVLSKPKKIKVKEALEYPKKIKIGEDGLIIRSSYGSGLLLPQVFTEYNATAEQALSMTCEKAGIEKDAWKTEGVEIYKFQAQIFSEKNGSVVEKENGNNVE